MDFSGFVMLVMGFNGAKADAVKAYINAFNWMSAELRKYSESYEAERNAVMLEYMKEGCRQHVRPSAQSLGENEKTSIACKAGTSGETGTVFITGIR